MKKHKLTIDNEYDFSLIGISSTLKDYQVCFWVNKQLDIELKAVFKKDKESNEEKRVEIEFFNNKTKCLSFHSYHAHCTEHVDYFLLSNKASDNYLVPEMKTISYFLQIRGFVSSEDLENYIKKLKDVSHFLLVTNIDPHQLKSKENLII